VYVIKADQTAELRQVQIEAALSDVTVITTGLQVGEQVVTEGQNQLRPGSRVQTRPASGPKVPGQEDDEDAPGSGKP
jgi:multidrug efflux pump subunit AcrA (membrane-fusion protein)